EGADAQDGTLQTQWNADPVANVLVNGRKGGGPLLSWFSKYEGSQFANTIDQNCGTVTPPTAGNPGTPGSLTQPAGSTLNINCPVGGYTVGGSGGWENLIADRIGTRLAGTNFVRAAGHHQFMYGWDFE